MHFVESSDLLLNIALVDVVGSEDDLGAGRWRFKLTLLGLIVVVVMLISVPDFMVYIGHRICKGIKVFLSVLLAHKGVVFLFLEANFPPVLVGFFE